MAYQIKKRSHIQEVLEVVDEEQNITKTFKVDIVPDMFRTRFLEASGAVEQIYNTDASNTDKIEQMQIAVRGFFDAILGKEQAQEFIDFYGGMVTEAFIDFVPFVTEVIKPKLEEAVNNEVKSFENMMK